MPLTFCVQQINLIYRFSPDFQLRRGYFQPIRYCSFLARLFLPNNSISKVKVKKIQLGRVKDAQFLNQLFFGKKKYCNPSPQKVIVHVFPSDALQYSSIHGQ